VTKLTKVERDELTSYLKKNPYLTVPMLRRYKPDPSLQIAGNGFLARKSLTLLTAEMGSGKSTFFEQMAICLALGSPLLGRIQVHGPQKVLYVEAEDEPDTLKRDVESITRGLGKEGDPVKNLFTQPVPSMDHKKFFHLIRLFVGDIRPSVLMVNPYLSYSPGCDTSDAADASEWRAEMTKILVEFNVALWMATHTKKPLTPGKLPKWEECVGANMTYKAFGSSVLPHWARVGVELAEIAPTANKERKFVCNFSKAIERTGWKDENGFYVKHTFLKHSKNQDEPLWTLTKQGDDSVVATWESFFDLESKKGQGGKFPSVRDMEQHAKESKSMDGIPRSRGSLERAFKDYLRVREVTQVGERGGKFLIRKKKGDQSPESVRTGADSTAGVKAGPLSSIKSGGKK
jgi:hypothetical protein